MHIIYEDNHIIVVEKPVNIPAQEDDSGDKDMLTIIKEYLKEQYNKPGNVYLGLVHRLDRPVGGTMAFAKTSKAASRLSEQIRNREFKKVYLAIIHGVPEARKGTLKHFLLKDSRTNIVKAVRPDIIGAKEAILDYEVLESKENLSLVKVNLHTGRSHQIRVQFSTMGCPLYGDQKYGENLNKPGQQLALWSNELAFIHPTTKEELSFQSLPPESFPWNIFK